MRRAFNRHHLHESQIRFPRPHDRRRARVRPAGADRDQACPRSFIERGIQCAARVERNAADRAPSRGSGPRREVAAVWTHARPDVDAGRPDLPKEDEKTHTTHFLRADGSEISSKPGIYLATGSKLFRWDVGTRTSPSDACPAQRKNSFEKRELQEAALMPVGGGKRIVLEAFATPARGGPLPEREIHFPAAILGDTLFLRTDHALYGCAVHATLNVSFEAIRVTPAGTYEKLPMDQLRAGSEARLDAALEAFNKGTKPGEPVFDGAVERKDIEVTAVYPTFDAAGGHLIGQYSRPTVYMASDAISSVYSRSAAFELPAPPPKLSTVIRFPSVAIEYAKAHPGEVVLGVSSGDFPVPK